jgi:hypothetical protein
MLENEMRQKGIKKDTNTNNYSHPYKIYCTLLSVLMVLISIN